MISPFIIFFVLLLVSAFFSGSETVIFSLSRTQIRKFQESKIWVVQRIGSYLEEPRKLLVTVLLGNELCNVAISIVGAALVSHFFPYDNKTQLLLAVAMVTPIILIFGEIIPKNIALSLADSLAPVVVPPIRLLHVLISPIRWIFSAIADSFVRLFGGEPRASAPIIMEQEFRQMVDLSKEEGLLVEEERELIHNVFEFTDKVVKDIMTPITRCFMLPIDMPYTKMLEEIKATEFRRIPIYEQDQNSIIGVLHVRDLLPFHQKKSTVTEKDIRELLHSPIFVNELEPIEKLLRKIQSHRVHLAIVADRERKVLGMVTLHDVLEELFGEIESD